MDFFHAIGRLSLLFNGTFLPLTILPNFFLLQLNLTHDYVYGNSKLFGDFCDRRKYSFNNGSKQPKWR